MAESSTQVRLLQHHLRQSGTLLASGQLDAAAEHLDAALAIDPASLAALTLRERLTVLRASNGRPAGTSAVRANALAPAPPEPTAAPSNGRFVPMGVNAASWTDFEQRVQHRRFRALIEAGERAVASGDLTAARNALDEARELQPESLEVSRLSIHLATMPMVAAENAKREGLFRSRTFRAASLLLLGVSLVMGLDWVRSDQVGTPSRNQAAVGTGGLSVEDVAAASEEPTVVSAQAEADNTDSTPLEPDVDEAGDVATPAFPRPLAVAPPVPASPTEQVRDRPSGETPDSYVALPANRLASSVVTTSPIVNGEVPDSYVAPVRRPPNDGRDAAPVVPAGRAGTPTPIASVVRQPPIVEGFGTSAGTSTPLPAPTISPAPVAPSAAASAAAIVPSVNEAVRVRSVVDQYARAYGRLDVNAVRAVWPTVDGKALAKVFSDLSSQSMSFDNCEIQVDPQSGASSAKALCRGKTSYVRKVGNHELRTESRTVQFDLKHDGEAWKIQKTQTGR